ncbi:hypothetical protein QJS10_CPB15g01452 [Acorus calamus]|uniref:RNase H type-1 domain-containing protein n=1 Tax=Acorus calamus TaxID=4465 RepID=A0AAV9D838_ACOCL|nr:hypothetical protein QJS10_CPB15g01452 [Acorus calamus]
MVRMYMRKRPGSYADIDVLRDPWLYSVPLSRIPTFINMEAAILDYKLSDIIEEGRWKVEVISNLLPPFWTDQILHTEPPECTEDGVAKWCWEGSTACFPKAADIYQILQPSRITSDGKVWKWVWKLPIWKARNSRVFRGTQTNAQVTANRAIAMAWECIQCLAKKGEVNTESTWKMQPLLQQHQHQWRIELQREDKNFVVTDVSVDLESRAARAAYIIFGENPWQILGAGCMNKMWSTPARMEMEGISLGISQARQMGLNNLYVCSDAEPIIKLLNENNRGLLNSRTSFHASKGMKRKLTQYIFVRYPGREYKPQSCWQGKQLNTRFPD